MIIKPPKRWYVHPKTGHLMREFVCTTEESWPLSKAIRRMQDWAPRRLRFVFAQYDLCKLVLAIDPPMDREALTLARQVNARRHVRLNVRREIKTEAEILARLNEPPEPCDEPQETRRARDWWEEP